MLIVLIGAGMTAVPISFAGEESDFLDRWKSIRERLRMHIPELSDELGAIDEVLISREVDTLPDDIEPKPEDPDSTDTALVFSNLARTDGAVHCVAYNKNGEAIGRSKTELPPLGLRYIRASDISNSEDFVGQVHCRSRSHVIGSVVFIGAGLTDLPARNHRIGKSRWSRIQFPLVVHY